MTNNTQSSPNKDKQGSLTLTSTTIGSIMAGISTILPDFWKSFVLGIAPIVSPLCSFVLIMFYYKYIEPFEIVSFRARLERDKKNLQAIINDPLVSEDGKKRAQDEYTETVFKLANLGKDTIDGRINITRDPTEL